MANQTHWKKLHNPNYLGAYAFLPGQEIVGTIEYVQEEPVIGSEGKKEQCTVAHFRESGLKPLILNATNCKCIARLYKTPYIEEWAGRQIIMRVQTVKAFGEVVDAIRIKPEIPQAQVFKCVDCGQMITAHNNRNAAEVASYTTEVYGRQLCAGCATMEYRRRKEVTGPA